MEAEGVFPYPEEANSVFSILLVEDDLPLRKMMAAFLTINGYRVTQAGNG